MLSAAAFGVVGLLGWSIAQELTRDPVIIEPLAVSESLAKAGWSGEVLASQIRDAVREINEGAKTLRAPADYLFDRDQLDIVVPGASVSIRTLVAVVRGVLGRPARRVGGEVIELDERERPVACKETSAAGARYLLVGRLSNGGRWTGCAGAVGELPRVAARELVLSTTPYIYASFQYEHDREQAKTIAEGILANNTNLRRR